MTIHDDRYAAARDAMTELTEAAVLCRAWGHTWGPCRVQVERAPVTYYVVQICGTCGATRNRTLDRFGYPLNPWKVRYEPGYLVKGRGILGGDGRALFRVASLTREAS